MKALVNTGPGQLELLDLEAPPLHQNQVLVRTGACAICATDLQMIAGWDRTGFPAVPGHEWSGTIVAGGAKVSPDWVGCHCVAENVLSDGGEVGFEHSGGYGEYLVTEADKVHLIPAAYPLRAAALIEPLAVSVRAVRRLRSRSDAAIVLGDGAIGLLILALLRRAGVAQVTVVGGRSGRLAVAREWGAASVCDYHGAGEDLSAWLLERSARYPLVVEASGSPSALSAALAVAARGARVLVVGDYGEAEAHFRWNHLLHQELALIGSCASAGAWPEAVELAVSGAIPLERLVSHALPLENHAQAFALAKSHRQDVIKVVLLW